MSTLEEIKKALTEKGEENMTLCQWPDCGLEASGEHCDEHRLAISRKMLDQILAKLDGEKPGP